MTKGALILRDLDLLGELARHRLVRVLVSLTSLDTDLKRSLEPRAASPETRLRMIDRLAEAGVPVGTLISPVIPGLTDHELERLLGAARDAGAMDARWMLLRLPREVAPLFEGWLAQHYPERAAKVMSLIRQCRGGATTTPASATACAARACSPTCWTSASARPTGGLISPAWPSLDCASFRPPRRQGELFE